MLAFGSHDDRSWHLLRGFGWQEKFDCLALFEMVEVDPEQIGAVEENFLSVFSVDEAETARVNELIDYAAHEVRLSKCCQAVYHISCC
jgi:hypothetical protein